MPYLKILWTHITKSLNNKKFAKNRFPKLPATIRYAEQDWQESTLWIYTNEMGDTQNTFLTKNGTHSFETCSYAIPSVTFSRFLKTWITHFQLFSRLFWTANSDQRAFWFGRRILMAFQHHQLLTFNTGPAETECFKEASRFISIVFTCHFTLITA